MKKNDRTQFKHLMERAKVSLPSRMNLTIQEEVLRIDVFWEELSSYSIISVTNAFQRAFGELRWFPTPADIKDFILRESEHLSLSNNNIQIEYITGAVSKERTKEIIDEVNKKMREIYPDWDKESLGKGIKPILQGLRNVKSVLTGKEAKEFEEKRRIHQEKIKLIKGDK